MSNGAAPQETGKETHGAAPGGTVTMLTHHSQPIRITSDPP